MFSYISRMTRLLVTFLLSIHTFLALASDPIVRTKNGQVRGQLNATVDAKTPYYAFRGIPYAKPPIGDLRFRSPLPANNWEGILNATKDKSKCVQPFGGKEDCLYINVYTPQLPINNETQSLSVMVWIHGGYFLAGSSEYELFGPDYLLNRGVVFVSFNYRLGIFGFLSTADEACPGNFGLKDQILALKWVQNNIAAFGGNPDDVTVFGESAGSASIAYLSQSPQSTGLYKKAILQSGSTLCLWAFARNPRSTAFQVGLLNGIVTTDSAKLVERLRKVDSKVLNTISTGNNLAQIVAYNPLAGFVFAPVIEPEGPDAILTDKSHEILKEQKMNNVTYMMGFNSLEGKFFSTMLTYLKAYLVSYDLVPLRLVPVDMNAKKLDEMIVANEIKKHYFHYGSLLFKDTEFLKFVSDDQFVRPIKEMIRLYSISRKVYVYTLSYEGLLGSDDRDIPGVGHAEDLPYIFRTERDSINVEHLDLTTRYRMIRLWTNFAKTGNPTPVADALLQNIKWPRSNAANNYSALDIGSDLVIVQNPHKDATDFYDPLYLKYGVPPYDTY